MGCAVDMKTEKNEVKGKVEGEAGGGKREMPDSLFLESDPVPEGPAQKATGIVRRLPRSARGESQASFFAG